jgi:hypothetical protein
MVHLATPEARLGCNTIALPLVILARFPASDIVLNELAHPRIVIDSFDYFNSIIFTDGFSNFRIMFDSIDFILKLINLSDT